MKAIPNYPYCFVCGDKNKRGLNVRFYASGGKAKAEFTPTKEFQGYKNILHGGIISTLLDEVMIQAIIAQGILTFTTQIEVKFKNPARIGEKLLLEGVVVEDRGKIIMTKGEAAKADGTVLAVSTGKFFRVRGEMKRLMEEQRNVL